MQTQKILSAAFLCLSAMSPCLAQVPLPGNTDTIAPLPGADLRPPASPFPETETRVAPPAPVATSAPTPGRTGKSAYGHLPLTAKDAKNRLVELRNALAVSRPHDLQEPIVQLAEWLNDSADAHNKMAAAFAKHDELKSQYLAEKQIGLKFSQLKREAQLLKADLLIAQKRYPEALGPLVEIVLADPTSGTGKTAYQRLKDLGFSHDVESSSAAAKTASTVETVAPSAKAEAGASTSTVETTVKATAIKPTAKVGTSSAVRAGAKPSVRSVSIATKKHAH